MGRPVVAVTRSISFSAPLVGRDDESAVLNLALSSVLGAPMSGAQGSPGQVALVGGAGTGKSRMAREVIDAARAAGARALVGRAVPGPGPAPYRPLREALLSWTREEAVSVPGDPYADALAPLVQPGVHPLSDPVPPVFVGEALLRTLADATRSEGFVLVLEDLHWADAETLAVVEYLCDNASVPRLLLLLTCRDEGSSAARDLLKRLTSRGSVVSVGLGPLHPEETAELAGALLGAPPTAALAALLQERSDGVPLLVEELVAALGAGGGLVPRGSEIDADAAAAAVLPDSVADTVLGRLEGLTSGQRQVLQTAAILGRTIDWSQLVAVTDLPETDVLTALKEATGLALLEEHPDRPGSLRFRHALVRDAVELSAFPPERVLLARRALNVVVDGAEPDQVPEDTLPLAVDLAARSGQRPLATRLALRAAAAAFDRWALSTAEAWLAEARRLAETEQEIVAIDLENLRVAALVGRLDVVTRLGRGLLARGQELPPAAALETRLRLAQATLENGQFAEGEAHLVAAHALLGSVDDACAWTRHELYSSVAALGQGDPGLARRRAVRTVELARPHGDQRDLVCAGLLQLGRSLLPDVDAAREAWMRGLVAAEDAGLRLWRARMLAEIATLALSELSGDEDLDAAALGAQEAGAVELAQRVSLMCAELALLRGRLDVAEDQLRRAAQTAPDTVVAATTRQRAYELTALLAAFRGDEAALALADGLAAPASQSVVRGAQALSVDDLVAAARQGCSASDVHQLLSPALAAVAAVLDPDHGAQECALLATGRVGRAAARAHTALVRVEDDPDLAAAELQGAVDDLADAPWFAAMLARTCAPAIVGPAPADGVRGPLRSAVRQLDQLGLGEPADACRALLRRAGVPVPRRSADQAGVPERLRALGVTAREMDVLSLVAQGLTSREIGERLYLSPRTVEKHVERLMVKTGAVNRAALAAIAGS